MAGGPDTGDKYSLLTGFVFVFNLVIGVGALALPQGFLAAGYLAGALVLVVVAIFSYIGIAFIIETHASALAVRKTVPEEDSFRLVRQVQDASEEDQLLLPPDLPGEELFAIEERIELGLMSRIFLGNIGEKLFYVVLVIYLLGDLAIYAATVPSSIVLVINQGSSSDCNGAEWKYNVCLAAFTVAIVPWAFFNFQKTKYLQMGTLFLRNFSLLCMVILSIVYIGDHKDEEPVIKEQVPLFVGHKLPFMFGTSIYAFMCHHSLPSIVTPIENKKRLFWMFFGDFLFILAVYVGVCLAAVFAFGASIQSLLTFQFIELAGTTSSKGLKGLYNFLGLYPVFTLSSNYPLIAITLRNNLMNLITWQSEHPVWGPRRPYFFSALAALPPIGIAFATHNVKYLVNYTGSYAGLGIMLVVPAILVIFARKRVAQLLPGQSNPYRHPLFRHDAWAYVILLISAAALALITYNNVADHTSAHSGSGSGSASVSASGSAC